MKLRTTILSLLLMGSLASQAIPVDPRPRTVLLPDGTSIIVTLVGDEHGSWAVAEDGRALRYNDAVKAYEYMTDKQLSELKAVREAHRERFALPAVKADMQQTTASNVNNNGKHSGAAKAEGNMLPEPGQKCNDYPTIGERHSLVILVEFQDQKFESISDPKAFYTRHLNEQGFSDNGAMGSARDFYITASAGLFKPTFDVVGPVLLPQKMPYYGANEGQSSDAYVGRLCYDAVTVANDLGLIDFTKYDLNDDGWVDNIFIYYAGYGEADSGKKDCVWPHSTDISKHEDFEPLIFQGKQVGSYACSNELRYNENPDVKEPTGIGTFVHEFGHTLGLPDLYTTTYNPLVHHPNKWSTMASGSYNNNMNTPPTLSSYERFSLGWITPKTLLPSVSDVLKLEPLTEVADAYLVPVEGSKTEYFMYENRQKDSWDEYLPGHGMLIWHIDYDAEKWGKNNVNNDFAHQYIDIVEADGKADAGTMPGDAMPGSEGIRELTLRDWAGHEMPQSPCFLAEGYDDATENVCVTFSMKAPTFTVPAPSLTLADVTAHTVSVSWTPVEGATKYEIKIAKTTDFIVDFDNIQTSESSSVVTVETTETAHTFTALDASENYLLAVKAFRGYASSEADSLEVTTAELPFAEREVLNVSTTSVSATGFQAQWDGVKDAASYDVELYSLGYGTAITTLGYDFTDKADGMPAGWETSSTTYYSIAGYYGESSPSLRMSKDQDYLVVAFPDKKVKTLTLWSRAQKAQGTLVAQTKDANGEWKDAESKALSAEATTLTYSFSEPQEQVRLLYNRDGGFVCIDDVRAECVSMERKPVAGATKNIDFIGRKLTVKGLQPNTDYGFRVAARNAAGEQSKASAETIVKTLEGGDEPEEKATDAVFAYAYDATSTIGFEEPAAYSVAVSVDNGSAATQYLDVESKKISSVLIYPLEYTDASDFKVWVSTKLPTSADGADLCTVSVDAKTLVPGQLNEIKLPEAVSGARFAGYSFNINKVETDADKNAVPLNTVQKERTEGVAWIAGQSGNTLEWFDYTDMFGAVVMGVRLEGDFEQGGVKAASAADVRAVAGSEAEAEVTFLNLNAAAVKSIGYSYTIGGTTNTGSAEVSADQRLGLLEPFNVAVPVTAPAAYGRHDMMIGATTVNGHAFDFSSNCTTTLTSLAKAVKQRVVEEEFTGTACGNCPRGMKGVEITESKYPDAIVMAIHTYQVTDPMYISYPYTASSYPGCYINRTSGEIDPYFGKPTSQCQATDLYGLDPYFMAAEPLADAGVEVAGEWAADGNSLSVTATADVAADLSGKYRLEFVVVGNDLHGSSNSWAQVNYFSGNTNYSSHPDLSEYVDMPYAITDMKYQHVVLHWWGGNDEFVLNNTSAGDANQFSTTLDFTPSRFCAYPEKYGLDREKTALVALLVKDDGTKRGEIINAAKVALGNGGSDGIRTVEADNETAARYDLMGRRVGKDYKGIVIMNGMKYIK